MRSTSVMAWVRWSLIAASSAMLTTGCLGIGGGGSGGAGSGSLFGSLFGGGGGGGDSSGVSAFSGGSGDTSNPPGPLADLSLALSEDDASVVHNPEPASLALFGSGLAGTALMRRRKARNKKSHRTTA